MKKLLTWTGLALAFLALQGAGNLALAEVLEAKSTPAIECISVIKRRGGWSAAPDIDLKEFHVDYYIVENTCKKFVIAHLAGFDGRGQNLRVPLVRLSPRERIRFDNIHTSARYIRDFETGYPFWVGACSISMGDSFNAELRDNVKVNIDLDAKTYSCGANGQFGSGKALFRPGRE